MSYAERLKQWSLARHKHINERVLGDGTHHVWVSLFPGWRCEAEERDYELACRLVWLQVDKRESWGRPVDLSPIRALLLSHR